MLNHDELELNNTALDIYDATKGISTLAYVNEHDEIIVGAYRQTILELATFLKLHSAFAQDNAIDCIVTDSVDSEFRFTVSYLLQSTTANKSVTLITKTNDVLPLISLQNIYAAFNWAEREVWDMYGLMFIKHPDMRRILTDYGFSGHPLRKDFPLSGFREIHYEDSTKHIEYEEIEMSQGFRPRFAASPWQEEQITDKPEEDNNA